TRSNAWGPLKKGNWTFTSLRKQGARRRGAEVPVLFFNGSQAAILDWQSWDEHLKSLFNASGRRKDLLEEFHVLQRHFRLIPLFLLGLFALPAWAQEGKTELKWKFEKGKPFYQELSTDTTQDIKVMGMDVKQKQKQTFYFSWTPIEQKDKDWIIKQK